MELFIPIFIVIVILVIVSAIYSKKKYEERLAALATWAASEGLSFNPGGLDAQTSGFFASFNTSQAGGFLGQFSGFSPFEQGDNWRVPLIISGIQGDQQWAVFDYSYDTESTSTDSEGNTTTSRTTHHFTVCSVTQPLMFPQLEIRPEGFFDRVGKVFGARDLNFEMEEFNRRFLVRTSDEKVTYGMIHPQMMEFLMTCPGIHWQIVGPQIVIAQPGRLDVPQIAGTVNIMKCFLGQIPPYLRQDLTGSYR